MSVSFGTTFKGTEYSFACEGGTVSISRSTVITVFDGREKKVEVQDERSGVPPEIRAWGEAIAMGKCNDKQIPEEALADLELVNRSGYEEESSS